MRRETTCPMMARTGLSLLALCLPVLAQAALIPPFFINGVVALGGMQMVRDVDRPPRSEWRTLGTGFFYGYKVQGNPDPSKREYEVYLVTARHVVRNFLSANREVSVRLNPTDPASRVREYVIPNQPEPGFHTWFCHPDSNVDLAAVPANFPYLKQQGIEPGFFANDQHIANRETLAKLEVSAGDGIFVLGFPMGLSGVERNYVIVRQGAIARISEMLAHASPTFMIDALVFPGNSGGPVVLRPDITSISGTKNQTTAYLIGLVTSYRPYVDTAASLQTRNPRITFEENSGLAEVLPTDVIDETIRAFRDHRVIWGVSECS